MSLVLLDPQRAVFHFVFAVIVSLVLFTLAVVFETSRSFSNGSYTPKFGLACFLVFWGGVFSAACLLLYIAIFHGRLPLEEKTAGL